MHATIASFPHFSVHQRSIALENRTEDFYHTRINNPDWILLAAFDIGRNIVGVLESQIKNVDQLQGSLAGYIYWTNVKKEWRGLGIGTKLKLGCEQSLLERGIDYIASKAHKSNAYSLRANAKCQMQSISISEDRVFFYKKLI